MGLSITTVLGPVAAMEDGASARAGAAGAFALGCGTTATIGAGCDAAPYITAWGELRLSRI